MSNTAPQPKPSLEDLVDRLHDAALTILVRTCKTELDRAGPDELEAVCVAMRARARPAMEQLLDDLREAPSVAKAAFQVAALDMAQAGMQVLRKPSQAFVGRLTA